MQRHCRHYRCSRKSCYRCRCCKVLHSTQDEKKGVCRGREMCREDKMRVCWDNRGGCIRNFLCYIRLRRCCCIRKCLCCIRKSLYYIRLCRLSSCNCRCCRKHSLHRCLYYCCICNRYFCMNRSNMP